MNRMNHMISYIPWRVRGLLTKLESDRRTGTDYFIPKFGDKVEEIFDGLPKPKDARKFFENDLVILFTPDEVQRFALKKAGTRGQGGRQKSHNEPGYYCTKIVRVL